MNLPVALLLLANVYHFSEGRRNVHVDFVTQLFEMVMYFYRHLGTHSLWPPLCFCNRVSSGSCDVRKYD